MIGLGRWGKCSKQGYFMKKQWLQGLTGNPTAAAVLSDGGIMSGVNVEGGSIPLVDFCWIRCMAKENCSRFSLPVCLVSASPLQTRRLPTLLKDTFNKLSWTHKALCVCQYAHAAMPTMRWHNGKLSLCFNALYIMITTMSMNRNQWNKNVFFCRCSWNILVIFGHTAQKARTLQLIGNSEVPLVAKLQRLSSQTCLHLKLNKVQLSGEHSLSLVQLPITPVQCVTSINATGKTIQVSFNLILSDSLTETMLYFICPPDGATES